MKFYVYGGDHALCDELSATLNSLQFQFYDTNYDAIKLNGSTREFCSKIDYSDYNVWTKLIQIKEQRLFVIFEDKETASKQFIANIVAVMQLNAQSIRVQWKRIHNNKTIYQ